MFNIMWDGSKILEGLYLGSEESSLDLETLKKLNINNIISVGPFKKVHSEINYEIIDVDDNDDIDLLKRFPSTSKIIEDLLNNKKNVLVHCHMGISRSPSVIMAFLIEKKKMKYVETCQYILQKRRICSPRPFFIQQLKIYEKILTEYGMFEETNPLYLQFTLELKLSNLKSKFDNEELITEDLLGELNDKDNTNYQCINCNVALFPKNHLLITHEIGSNCGYFIFPMKYMRESISDQLSGSISCYSCQSMIGLFSWSTIYCSGCNKRFCPSFQIIPEKVKSNQNK